MSKKSRGIIAALVLLLIAVPYAAAYFSSTADSAFTGILFNPLDGNSYLAKMYEGWNGSWRFVLPYTAEPGSGAYLFLYYLFLGHLARWTGLSLILVYHLARLVGSILLVFATAGFFTRIFPTQPRTSQSAFLLATFGTGLGWILALTGGYTADFWVAEAYPLLSMYANPHFPLGTALMVWIFTGMLEADRWKTAVRMALLGLLLSIVMPFGIVILAVIGGVKFLWDTLESHKIHLINQAGWAVGGVPFVAYQYLATVRDPILAGWNAQNVTLSPALWDLVVSLSPALLFGMLAVRPAWKLRQEPGARLLLLWFVLGLLLIYIPFNLQRRFMSAIYLPVAGMAVWGANEIRQKFHQGGKLWPNLLLVFSLPTGLMVLLTGYYALSTHDPHFFQANAEVAGMQWIRANTESHALILSAPDTGLLIPAQTGRRVLYGHPYETIQAGVEKQDLEDFYGGKMNERQGLDFLTARRVDFVFYGPREQQLGAPPVLMDLPVVFEAPGVVIYERPGQP